MNVELALVMAFVGGAQLRRHVQSQDQLAAGVPREGSHPVADRIQELQHEVQHQAWPTVSVLREGLRTPVKSHQELPHQTLMRRRCRSPNLSLHREHDGTFRGTGHPPHYRVHPRELVLLCGTPPSSLLHSTETKMRRNSQ